MNRPSFVPRTQRDVCCPYMCRLIRACRRASDRRNQGKRDKVHTHTHTLPNQNVPFNVLLLQWYVARFASPLCCRYYDNLGRRRKQERISKKIDCMTDYGEYTCILLRFSTLHGTGKKPSLDLLRLFLARA